MKTSARQSMSCPFCSGQVLRIVERKEPQTWIESVGVALLSDLGYRVLILVLFGALAVWSVVIALSVALVGGSVWFYAKRRTATYRCEGCKTALTFEEVRRGGSDSV